MCLKTHSASQVLKDFIYVFLKYRNAIISESVRDGIMHPGPLPLAPASRATGQPCPCLPAPNPIYMVAAPAPVNGAGKARAETPGGLCRCQLIHSSSHFWHVQLGFSLEKCVCVCVCVYICVLSAWCTASCVGVFGMCLLHD